MTKTIDEILFAAFLLRKLSRSGMEKNECVVCGIDTTPLWRKIYIDETGFISAKTASKQGIGFMTACNACGIKFKRSV